MEGGRAKKSVHFQTTGMQKKGDHPMNAKRFRQKVIHTHLKKVDNGQKMKI